MAKIVLTISADNKATQSVRLLNAEVQTLSEMLSNIKVNKNLTTQINALSKYYDNLAKAAVRVNETISKRQLIESKIATQEAKTATEKARKLVQLKQEALLTEKTNTEKSKQALNEAKVQNSVKITTSQTQRLVKQYADLLNTIKSLEKNYKKGTFDNITSQIKSYFNEVKGLDDKLKSGKITQEVYNSKIIQATASLQGFKTEVASTRTESKNLHGTLKDTVSGFLQFQLSAMLVMKPLQLIRDAFSSINETLVKTEDRVIELQRVVGDVANANELYALAEKYGQTFENVSEATLNFARRGMSWNESLKATEAALLAINVAELDVGQATDGLGAIMAQFGLRASELTTVVDMLNKTADNFPVTTSKILAALQRVGSTASTANLSLEETIGLITTLSKATNRSGENIGTALNSILNIAQKNTTLETFSKLGDSVKNVVDLYRSGATDTSILDVLEAVSDQVQHLDTHQIFSNEEFEGLNEQLKESMGEDFEMLSEIYGTAGTYRRNYFIALLNDLDTVKQVESEIANAQGYSQDENKKYLDTYTARQNSVQAKWQKIANDEQGILGLKKGLLDGAEAVLTFINYTGKLTTVFLAAGAAVNKLVGAKLADSLAKQITSWSSLSRVVNAQAKPAVINYTAEIKRLKGEILTTVDSETLLAKQTELLSLKQQRLVGVFKNVSSAISAALIVFAAINAIQGAIDQAAEDRIQKEQEELRLTNEKIAKSVESIDSNKQLAQSTNEYAESVKELREVLDSSTASESEKQSAQNKLLAIQNELIDSNNSYAGSLDLINGKLVEQLELVEKMSDEQLRQQAQKFLDDNYAQIADADKIVNDNKSTSVELLYGTAFNNEKNKDIIRNLIAKAQEQGIDLGLDNYVNAPNWNPIINMEEAIRDATNGKGFDVWQFLGFNYKKEQWTGSSSTGITTEGNLEERLKALQDFRKLVVDNYADLGMSEADSVEYVKLLDTAIAELNSTENQNAILLDKKAKASQQYFNGEISRAEYLKIVYGIEKDISQEIGEQTNNIKDATGAYDDLIKKLEELRDLQKENTDWEEKKLVVLEAEQALENARNEATVRRFNQSTGQWEWQTDEKAIAEAEENLEKAQLDLQEAAYDNIITQLEEQTATNESILAILKEVTPLLGEDFANAVKGAISGTTSVDLDKPILSKDGTYDSGGIANGLGYMHKATAQPESVNDPELTRKILTPVSNAEFDRYVKDMGIMFAQAHNFAQMPQFERVNNTTDNRIDNSGQITMNGVTIGSNARGNTLDELLTLAKIVPNT